MADAPRKRSIGKKLLIVLGIFVVLLVVAYFVVTSAAFLKGVVLPRVSKSVGADITVADASIKPFSGVELQNLKVQPPGAEPIVQAERVVARYSLMDIIGGNINVHEVTLTSPVIKLVEDENGKSNLDPLTKKEEGTPAEPSKKEEGAPPQIDIKNVTLKNATVQMIKKHADKPQELTELMNLNLHVDQLKNGQSGKLELSSNIKMQSTGTNGTPNLLSGSMNGNFNFTLAKNLLPENAKGGAKVEMKEVAGDYAQLGGFAAELETDISPTDIRNLALQFSRRGQQLGEIRASGPLDLSKQEGKLNVEIASIDKNVLNIFGGAKGIDFNQTKINSTNQIELSKGGAFVSVIGGLRADSFSITQTNQTTPKVDLLANYSVALDSAASNAVIRAFTLNGTQNRQPLLTAGLSRPMRLDWGKTNAAVDESAFELTVTNLNLADWRAFAAEMNPSGTAGLKLTVLSQGAGQNIKFDLDTRVLQLGATIGSNKIERADITVTTRGSIAGMDKLTLQDSRIELAQRGNSAAAVSASGTYALKSGDADLKAAIEAELVEVLRLIQVPDMEAQSGKLTFNGKVTTQKDIQTIDGKFALANFTGRSGEYELKNFTVSSTADIQKNADVVQIRRLLTALQQGNKNGGAIDVTGSHNLQTAISSLEVKLNDVNENALRPFLAPTLGERKLESVSINGTTSVSLNSTNSTAVKGDIQVTDLVISDPNQKTAPAPLAVKLNTDLSLLNSAALQIRALEADVTYGGKPAGKFNVGGNYNLKSGIGQVDLNLTGLNQNAVKVFMPKLGEKELVTISIDGNASANLNSTNDSAVKANFKVDNLVVKDPRKPQADPALSAQFGLDVGMAKQVIDVRQVQLSLSPTARAKNLLEVKGRLDMSNTNAYSGQLALTSEAFDVTEFYDLYGGGEKPAAEPAKPKAQPKGKQTAPQQEQEPAAMKLPVGNITVDVNIGRFYLREIAITNLQTTVKVAGSKIAVKPAQFTLNGAPVKADIDLDLGVPGYVYNLAFSADRVPLLPVANTFMPDSKGQYQGEIIATAQVKGAGVTGVNLKKNLTGNLGFTFTNANIQVVGPKWRKVMVPVATVLRVPEITESPVNWVDSKVTLGNGVIRINNFNLLSEAFRGGTSGEIQIADVFTNSVIPNLPVNVRLRRSLAEKANLLPENDQPGSAYVPLPNFVKLKGTIGEPEADVNKLALAGMLGRSVGIKESGAIGDVLQILGGGKSQPAQTNAPAPRATNRIGTATNQVAPPATNQPPKSDTEKVIKGIFDLLPKKK